MRTLSNAHELAPYLGLAPSTSLGTEPPTGQFRNIVFLGWGGDWEIGHFRDCSYDPFQLPNLLARIDGIRIFKEANP